MKETYSSGIVAAFLVLIGFTVLFVSDSVAQHQRQGYFTSKSKPVDNKPVLSLKARIVYRVAEIRNQQRLYFSAQAMPPEKLDLLPKLTESGTEIDDEGGELLVAHSVTAMNTEAVESTIQADSAIQQPAEFTHETSSKADTLTSTAPENGLGSSFTDEAESLSTVKNVSRTLLETKVMEIRERSGAYRASFAARKKRAEEREAKGMTEEERAKHYAEVVRLLYYFGKFVEWPRRAYYGPDDPHLIGALHLGPWANYFGQYEGTTVRGREALFRHCPNGNGAERVHVLFVNTTNINEIHGVLEITRNEPVLTVGSGEEFLAQGGIIRLFLDEDDRMRVEINVDAMYRNDLRISSGLLNLAEIYREGDSLR